MFSFMIYVYGILLQKWNIVLDILKCGQTFWALTLTFTDSFWRQLLEKTTMPDFVLTRIKLEAWKVLKQIKFINL